MGTETEVRLPDIGDFSAVDVIEVLVRPGDSIKAEDSLITLESDKATMEIPSPHAGVVKSLQVKVGDKLSQGALILTMEVGDAPAEAVAAGPEETPAAEPASPQPQSAAPAPAPPGLGTRVVVPDIGDFQAVAVIEVLVSPGDRVSVEQSLITLESDKATMEIPSPHAGVVKSIDVAVGDKLGAGDLILTMNVEAGAAAAPPGSTADVPAQLPEAAPAPAAEAKPELDRSHGDKAPLQPPVMPRPADMVAIAKGRKPHASPAVRRFARELGVDLMLVDGSGPKGRILKEDVQGFVKRAVSRGAPAPAAGPLQLPAVPAVDFARFGPIEVKALGRIKKLSGAHLHRCWLGVPHVTQLDEADITELEAFRVAQKATADQRGVRLTLFPFLIKACAAALRELPEFNSSLSPEGDSLIYKKYIHIGVAVDTPNGLMVPVVRDADTKGIFDLAAELAETSRRAREGKLLPGDMQGGTFSISSLGGIGGTAFTPIINAPEVAILGVSRSTMKPVWSGTQFDPRLMLPLSLSYDHRVIDGAQGVRFTTRLAALLGDIRRLLL